MKIHKIKGLNLKTVKQNLSDRNIAGYIKTKLDLSIKPDTYTGSSKKV